MPITPLMLLLATGLSATAAPARQISPTTEANCQSPRFSADGSRLSWERNDHKARTVEIWTATLSADGPPPSLAAPPPVGRQAPGGFQTAARTHAAVGAVWAPRTASARLRNTLIYGASTGGDDFDLFLLGGDGPLVTGPGADGDVAWSPGAPARIVFTSARSGGGDLYILPLGAEPHRLTHLEDSAEVSPTLSPDGKRVVYVAHSDRGDNLWIIDDIDVPTKPRPLTTWTGAQGRPRWSPDGRFVAFYATMDSPSGPRVDLVVSTPEGATKTVAKGVVADGNGPAWSPDGSRLVYVSDDDAAFDPVFAVAPTGGPPARVPIDTVGNQDLDVTRGTEGAGVRIAVSAQGRLGDPQRDYRRVFIAELSALP